MRAYLATVLTLAKFLTKRFFRDKIGLFFTLVFPLIFLLVFGNIFGGDEEVTFDVAVINRAETEFASQFVTQLEKNDVFEIKQSVDFQTAETQLGRGEITGIVELPEGFGEPDGQGRPSGTIKSYYDEGDQQAAQTFNSVMESILDQTNSRFVTTDPPLVLRNQAIQTADLSRFDYLFPGLLGFTILSLGIFGLANTLPVLKKNGTLRRLKATPLRASQLLLATSLQYLISGVVALIIVFIVGVLVFDFNMRGDYASLLVFAILSTLLMSGLGLAVSGWAKNENQAAPVANIIALPMFFLSGVFFPRFIMPEWLQSVSGFIPLTPVVDGMRLIMAEGQTIFSIPTEVGLVSGWLVVVIAIASFVFRWE